MNIRDNPRIVALKTRFARVRADLLEALAEESRQEVDDYTFSTLAGPRRLSAMFDGRRDLFVIHSMGASCPNCTLWADGFNGFYPHIADRASAYVSSPDPPEAQAALAASRGWRFPMVSHIGSMFAADMGFVDEAGRFLPGVSAFQKQGGKIIRVSATSFLPDDLHSSPLWHLLALLPEGADGWAPKLGCK